MDQSDIRQTLTTLEQRFDQLHKAHEMLSDQLVAQSAELAHVLKERDALAKEVSNLKDKDRSSSEHLELLSLQLSQLQQELIYYFSISNKQASLLAGSDHLISKTTSLLRQVIS